MIILILILLLVFLLSVFKAFQNYINVWRYSEKFPGPRTWPIVGNILQFGNKPSDYLTSGVRYCREFKYKMIRLWALGQLYIFFSHPKDVEVILSSTRLLYKRDIYNFFWPWLGTGLLTSYGPKWYKHRKIITPSFHFQILQDFLQIMNEKIENFTEALEPHVDCTLFDVEPIVKMCSLRIICETAMGINLEKLDNKGLDMLQAIKDLCLVIQERMFCPIKRSDILFFFTKWYWIQKRALRVLRKRLSEIIENRQKLLNNGRSILCDEDNMGIKRKMAFLDNLLAAKVDGRPLTFNEIFEEVSTFLFEGYDTTASGIQFLIYTLSRHPHIQDKILEEQIAIFGNDNERNSTYQEIQQMNYLELVVKENLRLYPSVPVIGRTNLEMIEINGKKIPPNTTLAIWIIAMGYNEDFFEKPCEFRPERYLASNRTQANPFDTVPFSAGPRNCIGQKFAMIEMKATISKLVRKFEFLPAVDDLLSGINDPSVAAANLQSKYDPVLSFLVTLQSTNGVFIRVKRRDEKSFSM